MPNLFFRALTLVVAASMWTSMAVAWPWEAKPQAPKDVNSKSAPASSNSDRLEQSTAPSPAAAPQAASAPVASVHSITQAAVQSGVLTCTSRINQISSFLTRNVQSSAFLFLPQNQPDQHIFSSSLEITPGTNIPGMYASTSFVPNPLGGCDAVYDTVEYVDQSCTALGAQLFKGVRPSLIKEDILLYGADAVKVFLMKAGKGCVVIKKEVVQ